MPYSRTELNALERHYRPEGQAGPCQPVSSSSRHASPPRETTVRTSGPRPHQQPRQAASSTIPRSSNARGSSSSRSYPAPRITTGDSIRRSAADKRFDMEHAKRLDRLQERYNQTHNSFRDIQRQFYHEKITFLNTWLLKERFAVTRAELSALNDVLETAERLLDRLLEYEKLDSFRAPDRELYFREKEREERENIADMEKYMRAAMFLTRHYR